MSKKRKKKKDYPKLPPQHIALSLSNLLRTCSCGHVLVRRSGETVRCEGCGAEWNGEVLNLPS